VAKGTTRSATVRPLEKEAKGSRAERRIAGSRLETHGDRARSLASLASFAARSSAGRGIARSGAGGHRAEGRPQETARKTVTEVPRDGPGTPRNYPTSKGLDGQEDAEMSLKTRWHLPAVAVLATVALLIAPEPARADHHVGFGFYFGLPFPPVPVPFVAPPVYYPRPVYHAPPPVYYGRPAVYFAPPPVYYRPPVYVRPAYYGPPYRHWHPRRHRYYRRGW
jgi:hypothetical protein